MAVGNVLSRYTSSGRPDSTFGVAGTVDLPAFGRNVHLQADGKLVVSCGEQNDGVVTRFKSNGELDSTFGTNGVGDAFFEHLHCSALQTDEKLVEAGLYNDHILVRRFKTNGQPDSSFGSNGSVLTPYGNYQGNIAGIGIMADGRIVLGGIGYNANDNRALLMVRYLADGTLDTTLNHTGISYPFEVSYCRKMILQSNGKPLMSVGALVGDSYIVRLNLNGSIDSTYGQYGFAAVPSVRITSLMLMVDQKLLCGGNDGDFVVARLKAEGSSLDSSLGQNGVIRTSIGDQYDEIGAVAIEQDGKIVAAGRSQVNNAGVTTRLTLVRYQANGKSGIERVNTERIQVAPNPVTGLLHIEYTGPVVTANKYSIISLEGKLLFSGVLHGKHSTIDVSSLSPGTYLLTVSGSILTQRNYLSNNKKVTMHENRRELTLSGFVYDAMW